MKIKLVIFDLDGTLADTLESLAFSINQILVNRGYEAHAVDKYKDFVGYGMMTSLRRASLMDEQFEETIAEAFESLKEAYRENYHVGLKPYVGIIELLDELTARNIMLAVNTNKNQDISDLVINILFPQYHFMNVIGIGSGYEEKPSPQAALCIMEQCKVSPEEVLFVGDSEVDFETAQNAGIKPILVSWGFRSEEDLKTLGVALVHQPKEILKYT